MKLPVSIVLLLSLLNLTKPSQSDLTFPNHFKDTCSFTFGEKQVFLEQEWNASRICDWLDFNRFGNFNIDDFKMYPPRSITSQRPKEYLAIPNKICIFKTAGWINDKGLLFNCETQYPLLMKRHRKDLDISISEVNLRKKSTVTVINVPLYSLIWPFNEYFSHSFTCGASVIPYMLGALKQTDSKVLIPAKGPFESLLISLGIAKDRLVLSNTSEYYYSSNAIFILRKPPFNILQAHWPANALIEMQNATISWLINNGYVNTKRSRNLVVYLSRRGNPQRDVHNELLLLQRIKASLRPGLELVIFPNDTSLTYKSDKSRTSWMQSAEIFVRAVAVIGPHGGSFGNIFLCPKDTTIIEFNIPWTVESSTAGKNNVRDLFYSLARGLGNLDHYWFIAPQNSHKGFYHTKKMLINADDVLAILIRDEIASKVQ